jgi:hypothetical protein
VASVQGVLEERFADFVAESGVDYDGYAEQTARLLAAIARNEEGGAR